MDYSPCKSPGWQRPKKGLKGLHLKNMMVKKKKMQLQERIFESSRKINIAPPDPKKTRTISIGPMIISAAHSSSEPSSSLSEHELKTLSIPPPDLDTSASESTQLMWKSLKDLCSDWSLKSHLRISSKQPFGWSSMNLKASEESSGVSAFVRCIDIDPTHSDKSFESPQLDTSMGAQFHKCCLIWQYPYLPGITLFPRSENGSGGGGGFSRLNSSSNLGNFNGNVLRLDDSMLESMKSDWSEAFRSAFNILRARQNPFFYLCSQQFTCLFCAAGTQGKEDIQVYITPSSKTLRSALKAEEIEFTMPYYTLKILKDKEEKRSPENISKILERNDLNGEPMEEEDEDSEDDEKWIKEMGISKDLNLGHQRKDGTSQYEMERSKSDLILMTGSNTLKFFNFLLNNSKFIISPVGPLPGIPPTILSPVTFHGASLRMLKTKQSRSRASDGSPLHTIELNGPILPHIPHMISSLLMKNTKNFKIHSTTLPKTDLFNINSVTEKKEDSKAEANVFQLQNLSDCGLKKSIIEILCRSDNTETIREFIECKNGVFSWT